MKIGVCSNCESEGPICTHCWKCPKCCECDKIAGKQTGGHIANGESFSKRNKKR